MTARTLEAQWEAALRTAEQVEHEYEQWRLQPGLTLSAADRDALRALGENFPTLWHAPTTTVVDRKRLLRLVIRDVLLDNRRARGQVWLQINWQTGAVTEHWLRRCTLSYSQHADLEEVKQRVLSLHAAGHVDTEIAATLNRTGFCTAQRAAVQWSCGVVLTTELGTATGGDHGQHRADSNC
jgi:hypothetical protein